MKGSSVECPENRLFIAGFVVVPVHMTVSRYALSYVSVCVVLFLIVPVRIVPFRLQYYGEVLSKKPVELHRFYKDESTFCHASGTKEEVCFLCRFVFFF